MRKTALIIVDMQYRYVFGSEAVPNAMEILDSLVKMAKTTDALVIATRQWSPEMQKTREALILPRIRKLANVIVSKGMDNPGYSAFDGKTLRPVKTLEQILRDAEIQVVMIGGLTLDECVCYTALDANALGFETVVPLNCTKVRDQDNYQITLKDFQRAGVIVN